MIQIPRLEPIPADIFLYSNLADRLSRLQSGAASSHTVGLSNELSEDIVSAVQLEQKDELLQQVEILQILISNVREVLLSENSSLLEMQDGKKPYDQDTFEYVQALTEVDVMLGTLLENIQTSISTT